MLATSASPFDSEEHSFEVKWDGVRALAAVEGHHWRLWGRAGTDYTGRYPELTVLGRLPAGTVVDGELVRLQDGRADLQALLGRHQLCHLDKIRRASRQAPVHYLLFDLLVHRGSSLLAQPLVRRRAVLAEVLAGVQEPGLIFSEGVIGSGREFYQGVLAQGHEGVMAKHLGSPYIPGKRSPAWRKIKPTQVIACVIIGYTPAWQGLHSLLVAAVHAGNLHYVGQLRQGLGGPPGAELARRLAARRRRQPVVPCANRAQWVEPDVYCRVRFLRWTAAGHLRDAVFAGLIDDSGSDDPGFAPGLEGS